MNGAQGQYLRDSKFLHMRVRRLDKEDGEETRMEKIWGDLGDCAVMKPKERDNIKYNQV